MAKYIVAGSQATISSSYKTGATVYGAASTPRRHKVFRVFVGMTANPNATDTYVQVDLSRQTAAGTATSYTPIPLDSADAACNAVAGVNATVEGTITSTSSLLNRGINQRGTLSVELADEASMPIAPATASAGFALRAQSSTYVGSISAEYGFIE